MNRVFFILVFAFIAVFAGTTIAQEEKGAVDYNNEAVEAYKNKDFETAYTGFSKAIELYKAEGTELDMNLVYNTGYCAFKSKKYDEAIPYFEEAIAKDFKAEKPYIFLTQIYMKKKDKAKKEEVLFEGLGKYADDKTLNKLAGKHYLKQGYAFYKNGNKIKKEANDSGLNETDADAYNAEVAKANAEFEKALPLLEKAYAHTPKDKNTLKALKNTYSTLKMDDKAAKIQSEIDALAK